MWYSGINNESWDGSIALLVNEVINCKQNQTAWSKEKLIFIKVTLGKGDKSSFILLVLLEFFTSFKGWR